MRQAVTLVAGWLADPDDGILALLPGVPVLLGDAPPTVVAIRNEYADNIAAHRYVIGEADGEAEVCVLGNPTEHNEKVPIGSGSQQRQGDVEFIIRVEVRHEDGAQAQRQADYLCNAVERCLRRFRKRVEADRTLDGVTLHYPLSMTRGKNDAPMEDNILTAGVIAKWRFIDVQSEGV